MFWLVKPKLAPARKRDLGDGPPSLFVYFGTLDASFAEALHFRLKIVTDQVEFMTAILPRMKGCLGRREGENQPSVAGVHRAQSEDIAEKGTIGVGIFGVNDDMSA